MNHEPYDIDSHDDIVIVINKAMEGAANYDIAKLKDAFHGEARMFGEVYLPPRAPKRFDEPISSFFELCKDHPLGEGGRYRFRIVSITRVEGAAMAMVAEDGCWGSTSFVDFFTVTRTDGKWKITNKTFAYTGGEIPEQVQQSAGL